MNRNNTLIALILLAAATPLSAFGDETVQARAPSERHAQYARAVSNDLKLSAEVRQIRVRLEYQPLIPRNTTRTVLSTGAEVQFSDAQGNPVLKLERLRFDTAEEAALFTNQAVIAGGNGDWAIDLRGRWVVRVRGTALSDPDTLNKVLHSAWKHGPKAPSLQARVIRVRNVGYVFDDRVGLDVVVRQVHGLVSQARYSAARGRLLDVETLTDDSYSLLGSATPASLTFSDSHRRGWFGVQQVGQRVTTDVRIATLEAMTESHLPKPAAAQGLNAVVGRVLDSK